MPPPANPLTSTARNSPVEFDLPASSSAVSSITPATPPVATATTTSAFADPAFVAFQNLLLEERRQQREEARADRAAMREELRARDEAFQQNILQLLMPRAPTTPSPAPSSLNEPPVLDVIENASPQTPREKERSGITREKVRSSERASLTPRRKRRHPSEHRSSSSEPEAPPRKRRASLVRSNKRSQRLTGDEYVKLDEVDITQLTKIKVDSLSDDRQMLRDNFTKALIDIPSWFPLNLSVGAYAVIRFMYAHERARFQTYYFHCDKNHKRPEYRKPFHHYGAEMARHFDVICKAKFDRITDKASAVLRDFLPWFKKYNSKWPRPYIVSTCKPRRKEKSMMLLTEAGFMDNFLQDIGCPSLVSAECQLRETNRAVLPQKKLTRKFLASLKVNEPDIYALWPYHQPPKPKSKPVVSSSSSSSSSSTDSDVPGPSSRTQRRSRRQAKKRDEAQPAPSVPETALEPASSPVLADPQPRTSLVLAPTEASALAPASEVAPPSPKDADKSSSTQQSSPLQFTSGDLSPASKKDNPKQTSSDSEGNIFSQTLLDFCEELLK